MRIAILICLLAGVPAASAAEAPKQTPPKSFGAAPPPPPLPLKETPAATVPEPETGLEPEITITSRGDVTFEEYRIHGKLYKIKVTPTAGKPYYLIDAEGSGQFQRNDIEPKILIPNWVIKSW